MWRQGAACLLTTVLMVVPTAATLCAVFCVDGSGAQASTVSAVHAHHDSSAQLTPADLAVSAASHDCDGHAAAREARATLRSSAELGSPDGPVSDLPPRSPRHAIRLIVVFVPSTHGPPGTSVSLAPPVLRI